MIKSIYQIEEPKRWDVVVFRNPLDPTENYIKRLIATPGESLEIIDGDIYINDIIQRKPENVQNEHWMPIYDSRYQPYIGNGLQTYRVARHSRPRSTKSGLRQFGGACNSAGGSSRET